MAYYSKALFLAALLAVVSFVMISDAATENEKTKGKLDYEHRGGRHYHLGGRDHYPPSTIQPTEEKAVADGYNNGEDFGRGGGRFGGGGGRGGRGGGRGGGGGGRGGGEYGGGGGRGGGGGGRGGGGGGRGGGEYGRGGGRGGGEHGRGGGKGGRGGRYPPAAN